MGFVLLAIFAWNTLALQGAVLEIVCHAFSTGALFAIVGLMQERLHTRDMDKMGGLWLTAPRLGAVALVFALASLGLPSLGNFVAEFLILVGTWRVSEPATVLGAVGLVAATIYSLWIVQRVFQGRETPAVVMPDLTLREGAHAGRHGGPAALARRLPAAHLQHRATGPRRPAAARRACRRRRRPPRPGRPPWRPRPRCATRPRPKRRRLPGVRATARGLQ